MMKWRELEHKQIDWKRRRKDEECLDNSEKRIVAQKTIWWIDCYNKYIKIEKTSMKGQNLNNEKGI